MTASMCEHVSRRTNVDRKPDRGELIADGIVHAVGILFSLAAGIALLVSAAVRTTVAEYVSLTFYAASLLAVFSISCAYNLWPDRPLKQLLRRADHAAIYLLIAGTYTPFLTQLPNSAAAIALVSFVWIAAVAGIAMKLLLPGRFDRIAVGFYLLIGWSGILVIKPLSHALPQAAMVLMLAGGIVYSVGVLFFAWRALRFQNAVWHGFVVTGAILHFIAVADTLVFARIT